jgi:murein DD-endopeptidase MepM/ murein hydrolase activator NlpD
MKKNIAIIFAVILAATIAAYFFISENSSKVPAPIQQSENNPGDIISSPKNMNEPAPSNVIFPIERAGDRVTKKPFGVFITPGGSPVQPERFSGYHTGTDFETFPEEADTDVAIHAICPGNLIAKISVSGYGGVAIQNCLIDNSPVTVLYGHLKLASIIPNVGEKLNAGDTIGILGKGYSIETDGERKHLHLGIHKGTAINYLGYVQNKSDLSSWIDACLYVCQ